MPTLTNTYDKDHKDGWSYPVDSDFVSWEFSDTYVAYRVRLDALYRKADMAGVLEASEDTPALLKHIYVPLRIHENDVDAASDEVDKVEGLSIVDALCRIRYLAISGAPGSGKSTLTRFLAAALSQTILNETASVLGRRVVVPFILRELDFSKINNWDDLWNIWIADMSKRLNLPITREFLDFYIEKGWAIVIFDGIDEIGEEQNLNMIKWINQWIEDKSEFKDAMTPLNIIITGRPYGYLKEGDYERYFKKMHLLPFNQEQIAQYSYNWFSVRYGEDKLKVKTKAEDFIAALRDYGLQELKRRPIYLAMLAYVAHTGELPRKRTVAYSKMVDAYIHLLDLVKNLKEKGAIARGWSYDDKIEIIEELAYKIHTKAYSESNDNNRFDNKQMHIQINRATLENYFKDILTEGRFDTVKPNNANEIIEYFLARTGLIIEPREGYYQFSHLTFQEYLTAARIYRKLPRFDILPYFKRELFDRLTGKIGWHEAALLFFGIDTIRAGADQSIILQQVIKKDNEAHHKFLIDLFAGMEHKISQDDVIRWLKTIVFVWVTRGAVRGLYKYLADAIKSDKIGEIRSCVIDYIGKLMLTNISNWDTLYDSSDLLFTDGCSDGNLLCFKEKGLSYSVACLENALLLGFFWNEFRHNYFNKDNIAFIPVDYRSIRLAFIIDKYVVMNKAYEDTLVHKMYSASKLDELYLGIGSFIYYLRKDISNGTIKHFYRLFICSHNCLLYLNEVEDIRTLTSFLFSLFKDRFMAMDKDMFSANAMARDMAMAINRSKDMDRAINRIMAMAGAIPRTGDMVDAITMSNVLAMNIAMAMVKDMASDRGMAKAMARDIALANNIVRDIALANNIVRDIALANNIAKKMDYSRIFDTDSLNSNPFIILWIKTILLNLYATSKRMADYMGIDTDISKQEFIDLYRRIETDDGAIEYFESECGMVDDLRKEEIKEWLGTPYSPRAIMKFIVENTTYDEFDPQMAIQNYHASIIKFNEWAEKTKGQPN